MMFTRNLTLILLLSLCKPVYSQYKLEPIVENIPEIDGCSCYFSLNKKDFTQKKYFYWNNFANLSFIKLNGKLIQLELVNDQSLMKFRYYEYANGVLNLKIWVNKSTKTGEESSLTTGKYQLFKKDKLILSGTFYGECGC